MKERLKERRLIIEFLTKVSKSASSSQEDEANVLIDIFTDALESLSSIDRHMILQKIASDYHSTAPTVLVEPEEQDLPF